MIVVIAILALVSIVSADPDHACCAPSPYSAVMLEMGGSQTLGTSHVEFSDQVLEVHYDYDNKIIRAVAHTYHAETGTRITTDIWDDYKYSTRYIVTADDTCYKQPLDPNSMQSPCVQGNLTYVGTTIVGAGDQGVPVWMWSGEDELGRLSVSVTTDGECIPVSLTRYGQDATERSLTAYLFTNVQKSVDSSMFSLPRQCANATSLPGSKRSLEALTGIRHPF